MVGGNRRELPGLEIRDRIGDALPAMYHDDDFAQRWCDGLDGVLAPVPSTIDNLWAYLDPQLAPPDFVEWLAGWVGLELDMTWGLERRRALVARAHRLFDYRGTARGLADLIELYTGVVPMISDGGGAAWSAAPDASLPGDADAELVVRLVVEDPDALDRDRIEHLVAMNKPAHVTHRLEIERGDPPAPSMEPPDPLAPPGPTTNPPPPPPQVPETADDVAADDADVDATTDEGDGSGNGGVEPIGDPDGTGDGDGTVERPADSDRENDGRPTNGESGDGDDRDGAE